jgi:hypothetical protein
MAKQQLEEIKTVESAIGYLSKVKTIETWAKAEKKDAELQQMIAEQKIRTQRILGRLIAEGQERGEIASQSEGGRGTNQYAGVPRTDTSKTLADIGLTRNESSAFKAIASIPEDTFEAAIAEKKEAVDRALNELTTAGMVALSKGKSNAMVNVWTGNQENYTPENSIIAVRKVLGSIDLDPASCELANGLVKAKAIFTEDDDGLSKAWYGNVFVNPPYQQPQMGQFADKLISELKNIESAIMLVNNNTDTVWFHRLASEAAAFCFTKGRIHFYTVDNPSTQPTNGQVYFYFGNDVALFVKVFSIQGLVVKTLSAYRGAE